MYCSKEQLKLEVHRYCCGQLPIDDSPIDPKTPFSEPEAEKVIAAFESVDYDLDVFMRERKYNVLEKDTIFDFLICVCLIHVPPLEDCIIDWYNGYLGFTERRFEDKEFRTNYSATENELLHQLYYCSTDQLLWEFMSRGIGDLNALYKWYQGINPEPDFEEVSGVPCYCEPNPEKTKRFEEFFVINHKKHNGGLWFSIEDEEFERWVEFHNNHIHKDAVGKQGDSYEFNFYMSGIGTIAKVKCLDCGEEEILTDLDSL